MNNEIKVLESKVTVLVTEVELLKLKIGNLETVIKSLSK